MDCVTAGRAAQFVLTARRNNSPSSSGRELEIGRHMNDEERLAAAGKLRRELRNTR
jgi:hypothetical protein